MTFGFARKFISRLESFLPIDPTRAKNMKKRMLHKVSPQKDGINGSILYVARAGKKGWERRQYLE